MISENAKIFFESYFGEKSTQFTTLAQSGSARVNFLAQNKKGDFIITYNENISENECFFYFSKVFSSLNLNTPTIFHITEDRKMYIQENVGNATFSEIISAEGSSDRVKLLAKQTLQKLYILQTTTKDKIDFAQTFEYEKYDELPVMHDLYYFKNFVADVLELEYHKSTLLKEFKKIVSLVENTAPQGLMIRDFQARNIMVNNYDEVAFIDYQSAMQGPLMYDVISFLYQAKANFSTDFKAEMLDFYIQQFVDEKTKTDLRNSIQPIQLMRFLQVLGAYGFRGLIQKKQHFIASIDKGIENIVEFSASWESMNQYPELKKVISQLNTLKTKEKISALVSQ
ncbi:MAG: phosphotransferase [Chryseobacterium sp.]|nr:phosphotransferase [Candidatus Chryseobacterium enterohippi]